MSGLSQLDVMIKRVQDLPKRAQKAAEEATAEIRAHLRSQIASGRGPGGKAWEPTVDGKKPLKNAAEAVKVTFNGKSFVFEVAGFHKYHHEGTATLPARPLIPTGSIPKFVVDILQRAIEKNLGGG
jgi:hypothetical protein